ncbi:MAG TPA: hypothetical protein VEI02_00150, partial [Planctomycetota bacterium]|nr:hypothetical protein [Planctomycetota bacterium]
MKFSQALVPFALVSAFAASAAAQSGSPVVNGSFEADANNAEPSGWMTTGGVSYVTNVPDGLFPTSGSKYLVVDVTDGIGPTLPGHGPHCWNCGGQVRQYVVRPAGERCFLSLDWDFLPTEDAYPGFYNDFLSIDVVHGVTESLIANVVYIDTGMTAGAIPYTNVPGAAGGQITWLPPQSIVFPGTTATPAPAGPKRAVVDLSSVPVGTSMRIDVFVGNVGDSYIPSKAYVDNVVLSGGKPNFDGGAAALRVLGSAHADGTFADGDWSDDALPGAPYVFRAAPGQHLSFRARGEAGLAWAMILAAPLDMGVPTAFGQINVDVFSAPFLFLANGFPGGGGG